MSTLVDAGTYPLFRTTSQHLDVERTCSLPASFESTSDLCCVGVDGRRCFGEDVYVICSHSFLGDEHLLGTVDDEVAALQRLPPR